MYSFILLHLPQAKIKMNFINPTGGNLQETSVV